MRFGARPYMIIVVKWDGAMGVVNSTGLEIPCNDKF